MTDMEKFQYSPQTICISIDDDSSTAPHPIATQKLSIRVVPVEPTVSRPGHLYPEWSPKGNLTVVGASIALFFAFGLMNAFGTFQTWYATHQLKHLPASTISWIGSLQLWTFFFSGAPIGRLFDAYGPTRLMMAGTLCYVTSIVLTSVCTRYYQYIMSQGVLFGLSVGLLFYPSLSSISTHFSKYRATALGIAAAGSGLGGVVFPIMMQRLFEQIGFGWGIRIIALIGFVGCTVATLTVTSLSTKKKPGPYFDVTTVSDSKFILLAIGSCFVALGLFNPFFYIVDYARRFSISEHMSFYVLAVMNAGGVLGRIAPAYASDRVGRFNLLTPSAFLCGLSCVTIWFFAHSLPLIIIFSVLYGFLSGAFISLITPCVAQISDIRQIGTRIGLLYSIISFPSLLGGPAAGALLGLEHGTFNTMIICSGSAIMVGSFFILFSRILINSHALVVL
ncbi:hypothetical protein D9619_007514 [Psilocybe cf. subviscida]|uniref:Major facilitator superfamily (MFS) profile domain-containing protein n=1 Tax=Psilocybe cf. subviscida TaxID=2480587 RepID=A0A8H5B1K3_9AGAR|nr:hypothetical protein D9619_007514 [Psilocybe cf. subviscida]